MKTTYVIRDGKVVEKPTKAPIDWSLVTGLPDIVASYLDTYDPTEIRKLLHGRPEPAPAELERAYWQAFLDDQKLIRFDHLGVETLGFYLGEGDFIERDNMHEMARKRLAELRREALL